jgi:hypothetical protein
MPKPRPRVQGARRSCARGTVAWDLKLVELAVPQVWSCALVAAPARRPTARSATPSRRGHRWVVARWTGSETLSLGPGNLRTPTSNQRISPSDPRYPSRPHLFRIYRAGCAQHRIRSVLPPLPFSAPSVRDPSPRAVWIYLHLWSFWWLASPAVQVSDPALSCCKSSETDSNSGNERLSTDPILHNAHPARMVPPQVLLSV